MDATLDTPHTATITPGTYKQDIGTTTFNVVCNDTNGFSIYAIGYTDESYGKATLTATVDGSINHAYDISTNTNTSGDTSGWAMKLTPDTTKASVPTIENGYDNYNTIPRSYTKVATFTTGTDLIEGATVKTTYASYISGAQYTGTYSGKVKYTLLHPNDGKPPISPNMIAYLDTGPNINRKFNSNECYAVEKTDSLSTLPASFIPSEENTISLPNSPAPVYINGDSYSCNIFTDAEIVYMNKDSSRMFSYLGGGESGFVGDVIMDNWDSSRVENMEYMFQAMGVASSNLKNLDTSNVKNMKGMFYSGESAQSYVGADENTFANWDVSNVTDMSYMFDAEQNYCYSEGALASNALVGMANWNVSNVASMENMFRCNKIIDFTPLANWNVGNVTNMGGMFTCTGISDLAPFTNWDMKNVADVSYMFASSWYWTWNSPNNDNDISDLTPIANWDMGNVTNMKGMFSVGQAERWTIANPQPIEKWNVKKVTNFKNVFYPGYNETVPINLPIFTSRPGTWNSEGTYIPN